MSKVGNSLKMTFDPCNDLKPRGRDKSLLVVHCEGLGDNVLAIPFLSLLAATLPDHRCHLVVGTGRRDIFLGLERFQVIETGEPSALTAVFSQYHDLIFDLGTGTEHIIDWIRGVELQYGHYVGFDKPESLPRESQVPLRADIPMWKQFIGMLAAMGQRGEIQAEYAVVVREASGQYAQLLIDLESPVPLICCAPGSGKDKRKRWPPEHFAELLRRLNAAQTCRFALLGKTGEEGLAEAIAAELPCAVDNLVGLTPLGALMHIVQHTSLLIANDNGVMHLAGWMGTPTLGLFGCTNPVLWHPLGAKSVVLQAARGDLLQLRPAQVLEVALSLLNA